MKYSTHRFTLDMHSAQSQISIPVTLGDTSREFRIILSDGGNPYTIENGCLVKLSIKRPTGTHIEEFCAVEDNTTVVYEFTQNKNTAAVEGIHDCDVTVYGLDGEVITTARFTMIVSERVVAVDDVVLTDKDFTAVDAMLAKEAERQVAETERIEYENLRREREEERKIKENQRLLNETERNISENARIEAENKRVTNENIRDHREATRTENERLRISNEEERIAKDEHRDRAIGSAVYLSNNAVETANAAHAKAVSMGEEVAKFRTEIGSGAVTNGFTVKQAVNNAMRTANNAKEQSDAVQRKLVNISAQVQGIGRTYVVPDFSFFIDFLNSRAVIELKEDRNGDGVDETYNISVSDLKSGDNIIIVEIATADFWFEKNSALTTFETYTHNGTQYTLAAKANGAIIGGAHILETDYTVIEGHSISAAASAKEAMEYALIAENNSALATASATAAETAESNAKTHAKSAELAASYNYAELLYVGSSVAMSFDTSKKTLTLGSGYYLFAKGTRYDIPATTISYDGISTASVLLVYNTESASIRLVGATNYTPNLNDVVALVIASTDNLGSPLAVSTRLSYKVNGITFNAYVGASDVSDIKRKINTLNADISAMVNSSRLIFDTSAKTLQFLSNLYTFWNGVRVDIPACTISYNIGATSVAFVYNKSTNAIRCVNATAFTPKDEYDVCLLTIVSINALKYPQNLSTKLKYTVDGVVYNDYASAADVEKTVYVSAENGIDSNSGTSSSKLKTIQKAVDIGATRIVVDPGTYAESVTASGKNKLEIVAGWYGNESSVKRGKVRITGGQEVTFAYDTTSGLYRARCVASATSMIHKVFVSKTENAVNVGDRSTGYPVTLWSLGADIQDDIRFTPVLSLDSCKSTLDSFYCDGTYIYLNTSNIDATFVLANGDISNCLSLTNIKSVVLEDIACEYSKDSCCKIVRCNNVTITGCEFNRSSLGEGLQLEYVNGELVDVKANRNRNDGINLHYFGNTKVVNASCGYNYDDGISHHEGCTGEIIGGEFYGNGKGGVASPTHGAKVDVYNVYSHHNNYGIYTDYSGANIGSKSIVSGCLLTDNAVGIRASYYPLVCHNNLLKNNATEKSVLNGGSIEEVNEMTASGVFKDRTIEIDCVYGTINNTTGDSTTGGTKSTLITPDFLFAEVGKVKITASSQWHGFRVYEYDAEKNFLRVTAQQYKTTYALSDDCKFFKLSIFKNSGENIDDIPSEIAYTTISFYGLDYELYGRFLNAKKVEADVNKLKYPQTGELFVFPPSEEYPFPTGLTSWGVKRNHLSTLYGYWDALVTLYPDYVTSETLGKDASGLYDIKAYTITSNNNKSLNSGNKQLKILYMSCIHGDEVNCAEEDYLYFKDLLENHETGNNRVLWDNVLFKIIPICNPWGYENLSRVNSNGVNLNRNFSGNWKYVAQSTSNNYSGESAMSEVETQIISNFIQNNSDAFFCFNRHGTEKFTDSGIIGYLASWWSVDAYVYKGMANRVNTAVKSAFDWVTSDKPVNKTRSIFDIQVTSTYAQRFTGTLDSHWTLVYGKHGALIELGFQGNVVGSDYPNGNGSDFMAICIKILSETLVYPVVFNNAILRSDSRYEI